MSDNELLKQALKKLEDFNLQGLPRARVDPVWDELQKEPYSLDVWELSALKNHHLSTQESDLLQVMREGFNGMQESFKGMQETMQEGFKGMQETMDKPAKVASGQFYASITDLWDFELKSCRGDFKSDFQCTARPDYIDAVLEQQIQNERLLPKSVDGQLNNLTTPPRSNTTSSQQSGNASRGFSPSSSGSSTNTRAHQEEGRSGTEHVFGGSKKPSKAHLAPPKSPVCQEFYENLLPAICGDLESFEKFQELKKAHGERFAQMVLIRAIANSSMNKITLPDKHAPYFDEDMDHGTLVLIPICKKEEALNWNKGKNYSILAIADSKKTYRFCDMDHNKLPSTASENEIKIATEFVTDCILSLGYSLANHDFDALNDPDGARFTGHRNAKTYSDAFRAKVKSTRILKQLIEYNDNRVLTPKMKDSIGGEGEQQLRFLKIDLGDIPHFSLPHPFSLGIKSGLCLHKHATKSNYNLYKSDENIDLEKYVGEKGSMMLVPGCGVLENNSSGTATDSVCDEWDYDDDDDVSEEEVFATEWSICDEPTLPREIIVVSAPHVVTPEK
jgi:hypothetical protein